ncbi:hypothetical protein S100892_00033 (plasmid) [Pediococcus pentosaceus]|uniref:Uncharacterized protein n=1 Tax=Pediococcus pentosaceus TaxID=1255 RepID=A0A1Y0VRZ9_PEDPE|nr:hypothetical protein S100892_00033 [Pediococcus pentosaceus]
MNGSSISSDFPASNWILGVNIGYSLILSCEVTRRGTLNFFEGIAGNILLGCRVRITNITRRNNIGSNRIATFINILSCGLSTSNWVLGVNIGYSLILSCEATLRATLNFFEGIAGNILLGCRVRITNITRRNNIGSNRIATFINILSCGDTSPLNSVPRSTVKLCTGPLKVVRNLVSASLTVAVVRSFNR